MSRAPGGLPNPRLVRHEAALTRAATAYAKRLAQLAECNRDLAELIEIRTARAWTDAEHAAYLRLRRSRSDLDVRVRRAQAAFEGARVRLRDLAPSP
jgi:hypothetical protein